MDLKQISYILAIAKAGNMTRAAEQVHISQSALSQAYRSLEKELGITLFQKNGRGLELTSDGLFFCEKGGELLGLADEFQKMLEQRKLQQLHILNYFTDVVDNCDETLLQYQSFFPDICFERSYGSTRDAIDFLRSGQIDFALTLRRIEEADLHSECLIDEPVVILISQDSHLANLPSIHISQLDGETLTIYQNAESLKLLFLEFFSKGGAVPARVLQLYDPVLQVQQNTGFIFMPQSTYHCFHARRILERCQGILVKDNFCRRRVFLTYSKKRPLSPLCQAYFSYLRDYHALSARERCLPELNRFQAGQPYHLEIIGSSREKYQR